MDFDIFLSISQTPVDGKTPDEDTMYSNFFEQLESTSKKLSNFSKKIGKKIEDLEIDDLVLLVKQR